MNRVRWRTNFTCAHNGSPRSVEELFLWGPSSSTEVCGLVIHDIKEVEGVRQQEEQEDGRDKEIGDVEEIRENAHTMHG